MATIFLLLIYLAFISLGLPDTLLGSVWPVMQPELGATLDAAGVITLVVSGATILSSLLSEQIVRLLGTSKVTAFSGVLTAAALLGYSQSPSFSWLLLFAIPLGFGAGSVDTCLNNYASLYLSARHMNWLHCFYGVGATISPALMSVIILNGQNWRTGYFIISLIQFGIAIILLLSLPLWKGRDYKGDSLRNKAENASVAEPVQKRRPLLLIPGVAIALLSYAVFFAIEYGTGLWTPSYLVDFRDFSPEIAARTAAIYYACLTVGRFISGILSEKLSNKTLIRLGAGFCITGAFLLGLPLPSALYFIALGCIGLGCAPIFPSMIHLTPTRFGRGDSPRIMGVQMASAYAGSVFISPCIGFIAARAGVLSIPWLLFGLCVLILILSECVDRIVAKNPPKEPSTE